MYLLREPAHVSSGHWWTMWGCTYGSASSRYEWSLRAVSSFAASRCHELTVVGATQYPRQLMVEEDGADIVQVAVECEQASSSLVGPDLDLVVVAARDEPALVSVYSSGWRVRVGMDAHNGCVLWKSTPRTGPSCSSKRSMRVPMR